MSELLSCPGCARHHRLCEPVCPFCGVDLPKCKAAATPARARMSRAALVAAGAALLGAACDSSLAVPYGTPPRMPPQDAGTDAQSPSDANAAADVTPGDANVDSDGGDSKD